MADVEVDPSQVHTIEVDPSAVSAMPAKPAGPQPPQGSAASRFGSGLWSTTGGGILGTLKALAALTVEGGKAIGGQFDPNSPGGQAVMGIVQSHIDQAEKAKAAIQQGRYSEAAGHTLATILPLVGPAAAHAGERIGEGDVAGGLGETTGLVGMSSLPMLREVPAVQRAGAAIAARVPESLPAVISPTNPKIMGALDYLESKGARIPLAARTDNQFVRNLQKGLDATPLGAVKAAQDAKVNTAVLEAEAKNLIQRATPETPADTHYAQFRAAEADPANLQTVKTGAQMSPEAKAALDDAAIQRFGQGYGSLDTAQADLVRQAAQQAGVDLTPKPVTEQIPLPVDVRSLKKQIQPIYDDISAWWEPAKRNASPGFTAMKSILEGPDVVPASQAEAGLSGLKALAREGEGRAAGIGKFIVPRLQSLIDDAAGKAGPDVLEALQSGRKAAAAEIAVDKISEILGKGQATGGFNREAGMWQDWLRNRENIARQLPAPLVSDIEKFFLGARRLAENPNPSGTATTSISTAMLTEAALHPLTGVPAILGTGALAKLLRSRAGVQALTRGLKIPVGTPEASALIDQLGAVLGPEDAAAAGMPPSRSMPAVANPAEGEAIFQAQKQRIQQGATPPEPAPPEPAPPETPPAPAAAAATIEPDVSTTTGPGPSVQRPAGAGAAPARAVESKAGPTGADTVIRIPGEQGAYQARYTVRELDDVHPSHNPHTFQPNPSYEFRNDRNYSDAANQERIVVDSQPGRFVPEYLITNSPDAVNGAPVISEGGSVLGGNSRAMKLARVYANNPQDAAAYKALLEQQAPQFGIDPTAVRNMKRPVLVRELTGTIENPQKLVTDLNKSGTAALTAAERATADARRMSAGAADYLAKAIEAEGPDATLNDALTGKQGAKIVNQLVDDGVFTMQEKPQLIDAKTGALTAAAKERISKMLLGQVFADSDQMLRTPAEIRNKLERIVSPLLQSGQKPGFDILPAVRQSLDLLEYARAHGITHLSDVLGQESLFGNAPKFSPEAAQLAEFLRDEKPTRIAAAFRRYVANAEPTMFGSSTPAEAFSDAFGPAMPPEAGAMPPAEAKAAFEQQKAKSARRPKK